MILCMDVGNSVTNFGIFDDGRLVLQFRRTTNASSSSDEIGIFLRAVLRENGFDWQQISRVGCCSVVPSANYSIASAFAKYFNQEILFVQAGVRIGLKLKYPNTKEIGADLIAAAVGAVKLYPATNLVIVDMGTATTLEFVSSDKNFLGGVILPGMKTSAQALSLAAENLTSVEIFRPEQLCGLSTAEAIRSGLYYGSAGAIKEICYLSQNRVFKGEKPLVLGTGGFSRFFEDYSLFDKIIPELVLSGVAEIVRMN